MARGTPLTPEQHKTLSQVYSQTGNYAEAGRAIGVDESVARRALLRFQESERVALNARAHAEGVEQGQKQLKAALDKADLFLNQTDLRAKDFAQVVNAISRATDTFSALQDKPLRNQKLKEEIRLAKATRQGKVLPPGAGFDEEEFKKMFATKFGQRPGQTPPGSSDKPKSE